MESLGSATWESLLFFVCVCVCNFRSTRELSGVNGEEHILFVSFIVAPNCHGLVQPEQTLDAMFLIRPFCIVVLSTAKQIVHRHQVLCFTD